MPDLTTNYNQILQKITNAAQHANRPPSEIQLIAATKTIPIQQLKETHQLGLKTFGENRIQELKHKAPQLPPDIQWHFIGPLQTNKVRDAIKYTTLIHSLDRIELANEIEKRAAAISKIQKVLLEINIAAESSKHGCPPNQAIDLIRHINQMKHLEIHGLMTVAPYHQNPERTRPYFTQMRQLRDQIQQQTGYILPELSMGMSHDYEIAIQEGATMIRIGTALFGTRPKKLNPIQNN
jgi:pyridoxal phosphate enzyme (YggS family)